MIHIYTSNAEKFSANIDTMMNSVGCKPHFYKIHDINKEPIEIGKSLNHLAFGKKAVKVVVDQMITEGILDKGVYIGRPMIDEKSAWFFYGIHLEIPEIMSADENKFYVFEILSDLASKYFEWNPINDNFNFCTPSGGDNIANDNTNSSIQKIENEIATTEYGIEATGKIDTLDLIYKLIEKVDFSDVGLGKTLSKFDKIQLQTNNGYVLNILPNIRSDESLEKEINISYKDLLSLLKVVVLTGSKSIEFFKG